MDTSLRVLVAEDNEVNQLLIKRMLGNLGHIPTIVSDGEDAVRAVEGGEYDLVLMDIDMVGMDGVDATAAIRALDGQASKVPVVAVTAYSLESHRDHYISSGMNDCISKPIIQAQLINVLERCAAGAFSS